MKNLFLFFFGVLLSGCALTSTFNHVGGMTAFDGISQNYPVDAQNMAANTALELARRYPPGRTALSLVSVSGAFGETLESSLRGQGFALLPPDSPSGLRVGYVLDAVRGEAMPTGYARIRTSDGGQFGFVQTLNPSALPSALPITPSSVVSETMLPAASVSSVTPLTSPSPVQNTSQPAVSASRATGNQNVLLPKAVLTALPYDWRYQIPDAEKRALRVSWPKNMPWREAIRGMANEAGCTAQFDESARRVTLTADTRPVLATSTASAIVPVAPISALHPASLPEPSLPEPAVSTAITQKPEVKVEPKIIQDALGVSASSPVLPIKSLPISSTAASSPLPVIPASSLASTSHLPPAKTEESDGSDSLLLQTSKASASLSEKTWMLMPGSLQNQLDSWAERAGYQLVWKSSSDLDMEAHASFKGTFVGVIQQLFTGLHKSGHPLRVTLYQNNNVIEVSE